MNTIQNYMTQEQVEAYSLAASLSAANEKDRAAWNAGVLAVKSAEQKAIDEYSGEVKLNRNGQPFGGVHPALSNLSGYLEINGCYSAE